MHAGQFAADGAYPAQLSAYEIPYSASVASSEAGLPIADSTKVTSIPNFERHFERQTLTILGGAFFKLQPGTKPWQLPGRRSSTIDVVNQSSGSTVRTFSFSSIMCCNFILPLSAGTNIDVATFQLVHNPGGDLNEDPPLMFRTRGDQTVPVTGLSSDAMTFLSSWTSGLQSAVIPGEFTNGSRKILFFSGNAQSTESPAFGIVTLQSSGASAEFAGPFPVSGLPTHTVFPGLAVSRNGGQIVAYLGTIIPGVVANRSTVTIRSINLTAAAATAPGSTLDSPLTTSVVFDAKDIPYASYVDSIRVQGNFLYGFILDSAPDDSGHKASTLIKSDLNAPGAKATLMPLTKSVIDALDLTGTVFGFQIATEPDKQGNQVPYVFNTLADGSIVEIRKDAKTNALSDLTYWLRPEGGILKFGPVSIFFEWFLAGDTFIGSPAPGQLVLATKDQIRKSYVQSKTLPSEFAGAKQYRIAYLNRGNFLTAVISGDRIGLDPRSVKSGATTVSCPGFEAKVSPDGNFVVEKVTKTSAGKQNVSRQIVWRATTTPVKGSFLDFNAQNGRIALLDPYWQVIWDSGTGGKGAAKLVMQSDGNLVALDATKKALWDSRGCLLGKCTNTNKLVPAACEK
ncbi:hypothetical protein EBZ80_22485 [bacterium]|nr:hypothetical protein [bacterium]